MDLPLLWHIPLSHFNEKVRWALDYKGIAHRRRVLGPNYLIRAWRATGQGQLPILWLDGRAIHDSTRIIAALEERCLEPALYPADGELREHRAFKLGNVTSNAPHGGQHRLLDPVLLGAPPRAARRAAARPDRGAHGRGLFPKEIMRAPRSAVERKYTVTRWTEMPRGGHFPALEAPDDLAREIREFFRELR